MNKKLEENIFYGSSDDIKLYGLLSKVNDSNKIVVLCHGLKGDKTERNSFNKFVKVLICWYGVIDYKETIEDESFFS